jgi:hypothetical protein
MAITGSGTSVDPYVIYDLDDLELVGTSPYTLDKYYKLNNDIDASATADPGYNSGAGWLPIGTFTGNFNGDGHAITGLYINRGATNYVGFISIVNGGTVTGLTISNGSITGGQYTGAVVGGNSTSSTVIVTNCVNNNTTVTGTAYVGGIIGGSALDRDATGTITGNSCSGTVTGTSYVGGILGVLRHFNFTLSNNTVTGQINNSGNYTGGIAGAVNRGAVQYNEMTGTFGTLAHYVGGILGRLTSSFSLTITDNTVACNIPASGYDYIGGIVGILVEGAYTLIFNNNSYEGAITGRNSVGGLAGQDGNYNYTDCYIENCTVKGSLTATGNRIGGVFGRGRGSVRNITLNGSEFTITVANTSYYVGGVIGYSSGTQYITNCTITVNITGAGDYVGGIVGGSNSSSGQIVNITDCQVEANIGGRNGIGGITGQCDTYGTTGITLDGCSYKGTITSTGDSCGGLVARGVVTLTGDPCMVEATINGVGNVGGAFGLLWAQSPDCSLIQFKNTVVNGTGQSIGGVVGQLYRGAGLKNADINGADIIVNGSENSDAVGGICGAMVVYSASTQLIENCRVKNLSVTGRDYVGGIVGNMGTYGLIEQCNAINVDVNGRDRVGGLCGSTDTNSVITVSYSTGQVTGSGSHHGGLVGYFNATGGFSNCYSHCDVDGVTNVGGLIGYCAQNISTCYSKGQVSGTTVVGGLVGYIPGSQTATDCFWDSQTSGQANSALGTGKTTAEMKTEGTYTNWDFNTTPLWDIDPAWNQGYPYLVGYGVPSYLAGTIAASSSMQGSLTVTKPYTLLSGGISGQSSVEGSLTVWHPINLPGGTVAAESDLAGNLRLLTLAPLAGEIGAASALEGNLRLLRGAAKLSDELTLAVLGPDETLIRFLNPEVLEVEETHTLGGLRTITITHSLLDDLGTDLGEYADLLIHGNKVWRQFTGDGDSCLYVINDDREVDTEENEIKVSADEVAAELSDLPPVRFNMTNPVQVTGEWLATYVGDLFTPGEISPGQSFSYSGTIGVMGLLREIEEQTGYEFSFRYEFNTTLGLIERFLDFVELRGRVHSTPIEIGYNTAKIELEESEADVAIAAAPLGSPRDSKDEANTTFHQARKAFEDLVVYKTVQIPLWVTKDESGEPLNGPLAYPPYSKAAGQTYVAAPPGDSGATYKEVTRMAGESGQVPRTVLFESSEENPINLYWLCVDKIREKLQPQVKLETEMINMGRMAANDPTVYNVGDRVALQLPGRSDRVVARIQKTVKNPRQFDRDKVELGNYGIDFFTDYLDIGGSGKQPFEEL